MSSTVVRGYPGVYNVTPPVLPDGAGTGLAVDVNGNLKIAAAINATTAGTYNTTAPTFTNGQSGPLQVDVNGNLKTVGGGGTSTSPFNATLPANGIAVGFADSTGKMQAASLAQLHNADNQNIGGVGNSILVGGVNNLLNTAGNVDRQTETGADGIPAKGITTGAAQFLMRFQTTATATVTVGANTITPAAMSGLIQGVAWAIQVGSVIYYDAFGANAESIWVTAVTGTTFTAAFTKTHTGTVTLNGGVYNQERDAAGELDGASGAGTAVAAGYEYNGGHPNLISNYDREINVNAKGIVNAAITSTTIGATALTLSVAPTNLYPGTPVMLSGAATVETVYVASNYTPGSTNVIIVGTVANTGQTAASWDVYVASGPGLNGILPYGIGIEEDVVYDPLSNRFYLERSATQDGVSSQNLPMEALGLWNGATMDRATGSTAAGMNVNITTARVVVENRYSYATTAAAGTVTVKATTGFLHTVSILGGTLGSVTVYDSATGSGTPILPTFTPTGSVTFTIDATLLNGLTVVTSAATVINLSYR